jgi:regulator of nucleoside diphosphate kinase
MILARTIHRHLEPGLVHGATAQQDKISVLAPLGTAVLGYRLGDAFEWRMPGRVRRLKLERVLYQPEAAGDYHL